MKAKKEEFAVALTLHQWAMLTGLVKVVLGTMPKDQKMFTKAEVAELEATRNKIRETLGMGKG